MNGISNGDNTYKQLSNSDALVGMASDLPNPNKSIAENVGLLGKCDFLGSKSQNGSTTITLPSNFSEYRYVYAYEQIGADTNGLFCPMFIPTELFAVGRIYATEFYNGSTAYNYSISRASNTTVTITVGKAGCTAFLYGVK